MMPGQQQQERLASTTRSKVNAKLIRSDYKVGEVASSVKSLGQANRACKLLVNWTAKTQLQQHGFVFEDNMVVSAIRPVSNLYGLRQHRRKDSGLKA